MFTQYVQNLHHAGGYEQYVAHLQQCAQQMGNADALGKLLNL